MRSTNLAALSFALISSTVLAQQAPVTYKPTHPNDTSPPVACQASYPNQPQVDGIYRIDGDVKAPKVKHVVKPEPSQEARTRGAFTPFQATSTIAFVVDAQGVPQDVCILKPAGYGLDVEAAKAIRQYRFEPGKKDGVPVAVRVSMEVPFKTGAAN
jgi:TonB family protein